MKTAYLLYRKTRDANARPFAIDYDVDYVVKMSEFEGVDYIELPLEIANYLYDNKIDVLDYMKGTKV